MHPDIQNWSTRHSVLVTARRTAALVNVLTADRHEPETVAEVLRAYGELDVDLTAADVTGMRAAALRLREVFAAADVDQAASAVNDLLRDSTGPLRLTSHSATTPWHPHIDEHDEAPWGEWLLASASLALAVLVWEHQKPPGGVCASTACRNVFLARGNRGLARRYCSRRCATRERVATHRRTHR